jgi:pyridoxine/pyridoxamine 5'-phosphate oxidase
LIQEARIGPVCWWDQDLLAGFYEPNAMTLATRTPDGVPSARIVVLRRYDEDSAFHSAVSTFTNLKSPSWTHVTVI